MDMRTPRPGAGADPKADTQRSVAARAAADPAFRLTARKVALLVAQGKQTGEIARDLGISEDRVRTLKKSPLFQEMVDLIEGRMVEEGVSTVMRKLTEGAERNFDFINDVRDGLHDATDPKLLGVKLSAARYLGNKTVPDAGSANEVDKAVSLVLGAGLVSQMVRAMKQDGATIEVESEVIPEEHLTVPMSPEEFVKRFIREDGTPKRDEDEDS